MRIFPRATMVGSGKIRAQGSERKFREGAGWAMELVLKRWGGGVRQGTERSARFQGELTCRV